MSSKYPLSMVGAPSKDQPGFAPGRIEILCTMRGGAAVTGDVLMQDILGTQITADSLTPVGTEATLGDKESIWGLVAAPTAAGSIINGTQPFFGVAQRAALDLSLVPLIVYGQTKAFFIAASGSVTVGRRWVPDTSKNADMVAAVSLSRFLGSACEPLTTPTTRTLGELFINGIGGIGLGFFS